MAGRLFIKKFVSRIATSRHPICGNPSACTSVGSPVTGPASEGGTKALNKLFHGTASQPGNTVPHCYAARSFSTFPSSHAKTSWSTRMPSGIANIIKPASLKQAFSSNASNNNNFRLQTNIEDQEAQCAAWRATMEADADLFNKRMRNMMWCFTAIVSFWFIMLARHSSRKDNKVGPHCSCCNNGQCYRSES